MPEEIKDKTSKEQVDSSKEITAEFQGVLKKLIESDRTLQLLYGDISKSVVSCEGYQKEGHSVVKITMEEPNRLVSLTLLLFNKFGIEGEVNRADNESVIYSYQKLMKLMPELHEADVSIKEFPKPDAITLTPENLQKMVADETRKIRESQFAGKLYDEFFQKRSPAHTFVVTSWPVVKPPSDKIDKKTVSVLEAKAETEPKEKTRWLFSRIVLSTLGVIGVLAMGVGGVLTLTGIGAVAGLPLMIAGAGVLALSAVAIFYLVALKWLLTPKFTLGSKYEERSDVPPISPEGKVPVDEKHEGDIGSPARFELKISDYERQPAIKDAEVRQKPAESYRRPVEQYDPKISMKADASNQSPSKWGTIGFIFKLLGGCLPCGKDSSNKQPPGSGGVPELVSPPWIFPEPKLSSVGDGKVYSYRLMSDVKVASKINEIVFYISGVNVVVEMPGVGDFSIPKCGPIYEIIMAANRREGAKNFTPEETQKLSKNTLLKSYIHGKDFGKYVSFCLENVDTRDYNSAHSEEKSDLPKQKT